MLYSVVGEGLTFGNEFRLYPNETLTMPTSPNFDNVAAYCCDTVDDLNRRRKWMDGGHASNLQVSRFEVVQSADGASYECKFFQTIPQSIPHLVDAVLPDHGGVNVSVSPLSGTALWRLIASENGYTFPRPFPTESDAGIYSFTQCEQLSKSLGVPFDPFYGIDTCNVGDYAALGTTLVCAYDASATLKGTGGTTHGCGATSFPHTGKVVPFPVGKTLDGQPLWEILAKQSGQRDSSMHKGSCPNSPTGCELPFRGVEFGRSIYPPTGAWGVNSDASDYIAYTQPIYNEPPHRLYSMYPIAAAPPPPSPPLHPPPPSSPTMPHCLNPSDGILNATTLDSDPATSELMLLNGQFQTFSIQNGHAYEFSSELGIYFELDYTYVTSVHTACTLEVGYFKWPLAVFNSVVQSEYSDSDAVLGGQHAWALRTSRCTDGTGVKVRRAAATPQDRGHAFFVVDKCPAGPPPPPPPPHPPRPPPDTPPPPALPYYHDCIEPNAAATAYSVDHFLNGVDHTFLVNKKKRSWAITNREVYHVTPDFDLVAAVHPYQSCSGLDAPTFTHLDHEVFYGNLDCDRQVKGTTVATDRIQMRAESTGMPMGHDEYTVAVNFKCTTDHIPTAVADMRTLWSWGEYTAGNLNRLSLTPAGFVHDIGEDPLLYQIDDLHDVCDGDWHEIVVVGKESQNWRKIYYNGAEVASGTHASTGANKESNFCLGGEDNTESTRILRAWHGELSDFKVWTKELSTDWSCKCLLQTGSVDSDGHWTPASTYSTNETTHISGTTFAIRPSGCAGEEGVAFWPTAYGGVRADVFKVTAKCPVSASPPPPLHSGSMPYSNEEGDRHFIESSQGTIQDFQYTLYFSDPLNSGAIGYAQTVGDGDKQTAYDRCFALCTTNNAANLWTKPSSASADPGGATERQCRQFSITEISTGTYTCSFYDFRDGPLVAYETSGSNLPAGATSIYSTIPIINPAGAPNNPPSPASPPPPFADTDCRL